MKKTITFLAQLGFWPYVIIFTTLAVIISEILILIQSYWLTGNFFVKDFLIIGFITPLVDAFIVFLLSGFLIQYLVSTQNKLEITTKKLLEEKKNTEILLQEKKDLLSLFDKSDSVLFKWNNDENWSIDYVSDNAHKLLDYSKDDFLNHKIMYASCIHEDDLEHVTLEVSNAVKENLDFFKHDPYRVITKNNQIKWILDYTVLHKDQNGSLTHFIGYIVDITEQKAKDEEVQNKLQKLIDSQKDIVLLTDGKKVNFSNKTYLNFFGYETLEDFSKDYNCICDRFIDEGDFFHLGLLKEDESTWVESLLNLNGRGRVVSMLDKENVPHTFSVSINKYDDENYVINFTDISDTMIEKLELTKEATRDGLTNVYNRVYFNKHINNILKSHQDRALRVGIIFLDIDNFKNVNDTYGHAIGDYVLKEIASLVVKNTRNSDKLIRWGGEEFLIICETDKSEYLPQIAENLRATIESYRFDHIGSITCSFGCEIHNDENEIAATIEKADAKLYRAKKNGRNRVEC